MNQMFEAAIQNINAKPESEESMLAIIIRQLGGDAVAESMAREILNESSRD